MSLEMMEERFAIRDPILVGRHVLVVGLGRSGVAAAQFCLDRGAVVTATDSRRADSVGENARRLESLGVRMELGGHPEPLLDGCDLLVLSPGVPGSIPLLSAARERNIPIWGEVELAWRFCRGRVIGITGSNGKSTVTSMVGAMLHRGGISGGVGGNLFTPFTDLLADDDARAVHTIELSSFQLESVETLDCTVGVVLNLTPDHLDRYDGLNSYASAKARLLELQSTSSFAVTNADDPASRRFQGLGSGRHLTYSTRSMPQFGAFIQDDRLVLRTEAHGEEHVMPAAELTLPGEHNRSNALAAALSARLVDCPITAIQEALREFKALPHRLEPVITVGGVKFFNDSKATNPDATLRALEAFPRGTVHLILGGKDKGTDWSGFADALEGRVASVLLIGEAGPSIRQHVIGKVRTLSCDTVARAVEAGFEVAKAGETILLAPACASFDQYTGFEARGEDFRSRALALASQHGGADA